MQPGEQHSAHYPAKAGTTNESQTVELELTQHFAA